MNWLNTYRRSAVVVVLTLLLPVILVLYLVTDFWVMRRGYQNEIDRLQPRIARIYGLMESEEQLKVSAGRLSLQVSNLVYPPTEDSATVSAALQKNVREIMTEAGLTVSNSRILPVVQEENFDRIGLSLTASGGLEALDEALWDLSNYVPLLLIETIDVKPKRTSRRRDKVGAQIITVSLHILTLRAI